jgi:hypothetical protein
VFSEGSVAAGRAAIQVEAARLAEHQAFDADEATLRRLEAYAIGAAAGLSGLILAILGLARGSSRQQVAVPSEPDASTTGELPLRESSTLGRVSSPPVAPAAAIPPPPAVPPRSAVALRAAADLCTEFGRIHDLADLKALLGRAARVMDASGRSADNAAAAAYRTGALQTVMARPGTLLGAIVAPLLSADGCIGALTAEVRDGGETSEQVQALASIFAAQLAGILAASSTAAASEARTAAS